MTEDDAIKVATKLAETVSLAYLRPKVGSTFFFGEREDFTGYMPAVRVMPGRRLLPLALPVDDLKPFIARE